MSDKQTVIEQIRTAFQEMEFPGENFLQGKSDVLAGIKQSMEDFL
jgi:hypothetical protein